MTVLQTGDSKITNPCNTIYFPFEKLYTKSTFQQKYL